MGKENRDPTNRRLLSCCVFARRRWVCVSSTSTGTRAVIGARTPVGLSPAEQATDLLADMIDTSGIPRNQPPSAAVV